MWLFSSSGLHIHTWRHARWHPGRKQAWFPWRRSCCNHPGSLGERSESFPCPSGPHTDGLLSRLPPAGKCQEVFQSNRGNKIFRTLSTVPRSKSDLNEVPKYNRLCHKAWGLHRNREIFAWQKEGEKVKKRSIRQVIKRLNKEKTCHK